MEPLRPEFRKALKEAHPGLTDEVIDEYEKLTAMRYRLDSQRFSASVEEIDRQRELLLKTRMPQFAQVSQLMTARRKGEQPAAISRYSVEIVPEDRKNRGD